MHVKHVEIDFHFIRDLVIIEQLDVRFTPTVDQIVDDLTKHLRQTHFLSLKSKLMMFPLLYD